MTQEVLKLALEALDKYGFAPCDKEEDWQGFKRAITAIKEALAQEQEPVAHWSDCAVHSEPAYPKGECDCGGFNPTAWLVEDADDFFELVVQDLQQASEEERSALAILKIVYEREVGLLPRVDKTSGLVLSAFKGSLGGDLPERIEALLTRYPFIVDRIKERFMRQYSYRQPWILLAYLFAWQKPAELKERWPIGLKELESVFTDLGRQLTNDR